MDVLPATIDLAAAEIELVNMTLRELVLRDILAKLRSRYNHIIIDCPPSLGLLTINALAAATGSSSPCSVSFWLPAAWRCSCALSTRPRAASTHLKIAGILPTMFDGRTTHANESWRSCGPLPGLVFDMVIRHTVRVKESPAAGLSILDYDSGHDVAKSYMWLALEIDHA